MTSRWVMVDDADPIVQYGSGWASHSNVQDNPGNWGPPFDGTEHTTDRNTTMSLTFTGTSVIVLGKLDGNNATGRPDPYWDCSLDGEPIPRSGYSTSFTGHWIFCNRQNIPDGEHTFTLTTSTSGARTISVDQFQYLASPTVNIDNAKVQIDTDSVRYSPGWESDSRYSHTYQTGASAVLDFVGVSLQWYGFVPSVSTANGPSTAGYKIDGGEEVNFTLVGIPAGSPAGGFSNVLMFETPRLSPGRHQLEVTHYGSSTSTPLSVDYIFIQNATIPSGSSTSSTSSNTASGSVIPDSSSTTGSTSGSSTTTSTTTGLPINNGAESEKSTPVGAIVGGVIGGIALLVLIGIFLLLLRRLRRHGRPIVDESIDSHIPPEMTDLTRPTPYVQDGRDPSTVYSPYSQDGQASPRSWQGSQQALAQGQGFSQVQLLNHSQSKVGLVQQGYNPYPPTQTSPLTSPAATTSNVASSSARPNSGELPPPQYSDIVPLRGTTVGGPTTKGPVLAP